MNIASQFDVVRSDQKDEFYRSKLSRSFASLVGRALTPQSRLIYNNELQLVSDFIYYFYTNLSSRQTIGQEYTNVTLFDPATRDVPSLPRRAVLVALKLATPFVFNKYSRHALFKNNKRLQLYLFILKLVVYYSIKLNRIAFFLSDSSYYRLENRLTRAKHLSLRYGAKASVNKTHVLLGLVELVTFLLQAVVDARDLWSHFAGPARSEEPETRSNEEARVAREAAVRSSCKCMLCLDGALEPTATFCGHVFCWSCINQYAKSQLADAAKLLCPSCRVEFDPRQLIFLHNFK